MSKQAVAFPDRAHALALGADNASDLRDDYRHLIGAGVAGPEATDRLEIGDLLEMPDDDLEAVAREARARDRVARAAEVLRAEGGPLEVALGPAVDRDDLLGTHAAVSSRTAYLEAGGERAIRTEARMSALDVGIVAVGPSCPGGSDPQSTRRPNLLGAAAQRVTQGGTQLAGQVPCGSERLWPVIGSEA